MVRYEGAGGWGIEDIYPDLSFLASQTHNSCKRQKPCAPLASNSFNNYYW